MDYRYTYGLEGPSVEDLEWKRRFDLRHGLEEFIAGFCSQEENEYQEWPSYEGEVYEDGAYEDGAYEGAQ